MVRFTLIMLFNNLVRNRWHIQLIGSKDMPKKTNSVNVSNLIKAYDGIETAYGKFKKEVTLLYAGCKTVAQYKARRVEVKAAIDASCGKTKAGKEKAVKLKNKTNSTLSRILPKGMKLGKRNGGRKASTATATATATATPKVAPATATASKNQPAAMPLHDMDISAILTTIRLIGEDKTDKKAALAKLNRIENSVKSAMFALNTIK